MKRKLLLSSAIVFTSAIFSQQQPPNQGFENWENSGAANQEPIEWNSMETGDFSCFLCGVGQTQTIWEESSVVHTGSKSVRLETQQVSFGLGTARVNGTVTLGEIGTTAASPAGGYTRSIQSNSTFSEVFTGQPDSLVFWANYTPNVNNADHWASAAAILHETDPSGFFWNPTSHANYDPASLNGDATLLFNQTSGWERKAVSYDYSTGAQTTNKFLLLTFASTDVPGAPGDRNGDLLYIDDVMMIYNITTDYSFTTTCAGASVSVPFTAKTLAVGSRTFTAQLSDASGSFASPTTIGTLVVNDGDTCVNTISATIPGGASAGTGYKIRVIGDDAAFATVAGSAFSIGASATAGTATPAASTSCTSPDGQVAIAGGSGATSYELYDSGNNLIATNGSGSFTNLSPGDYYVTYVNTCGNDNTATVTVNAPANPTAGTLTGTDVSNCTTPNGAVSLSGSTGTSFELFVAGGATTGQTNGTGNFTGLNAGDYEVVVTAANGCTSTTNQVTVGNASAPAAPTAGTDATYCEGDTPTDLSATAGSGGTLTWYLGGNVETTGNSLTPNTSAAGTLVYTVTETVTGCESAPTSVTITVNPAPVAGTATPTASTSCTTPDGNVTVTGDNGDSYELFDSGNNSITSNTSGIFTGLDAGDYYVEVTNTCGTASTATVTVNAPTAPTAGTIATVAYTDCGTPDGEVNVTGSNGTSFELFDAADNSISTNATGAFTGLSAGDYYVVISGANGCTTTTSTETIADNTGYTVSIAPTATQDLNILEDGTVLNATESATATSREWMYTSTSGSGYMSFSPTETGASYTPNFATVGTYYVICESVISGCTVMSSEVQVNVTDSTVSIDENQLDLVKVYSYDNQMFVNLSNVTLNNPILKVYSTEGKVVLETKLNNGTLNTFNMDVPMGVYYFNIITNENATTGKVVLK